MAAELGEGVFERAENGEERLGRDPLRTWLSAVGLAVEVAVVADARVEVAQGNAERLGEPQQGGARRLAAMGVVMRVEVRGVSPDEGAEAVELPDHLLLDSSVVDRVHAHPTGLVAVAPVAEVDVKPEAEPRVRPGVGRRG